MSSAKRKKVKLARRDPDTWMPGVVELLALDEEAIIEYIPNINGEHNSIDDVTRLRCNNACQQVLRVVQHLPTKVLRQAYHQATGALFESRNQTYMTGRVVYSICEAWELATPRMIANHQRLIELGPEDTVDIYGGSWKAEAQQKYLQRRGGAKSKGSSSKKKEKKERGPSVTGTIEAFLMKDPEKGASKEEILKELKRIFPGRNPNSMRGTVGVQLSSHLKRKHGDKLRMVSKGRYAII